MQTVIATIDEAPGEADVVVEELEDRVRDVDQRLQDVRVGDTSRAGLTVVIGRVDVAEAARSVKRSGTGSKPPWLKGLQRRTR